MVDAGFAIKKKKTGQKTFWGGIIRGKAYIGLKHWEVNSSFSESFPVVKY